MQLKLNCANRHCAIHKVSAKGYCYYQERLVLWKQTAKIYIGNK